MKAFGRRGRPPGPVPWPRSRDAFETPCVVMLAVQVEDFLSFDGVEKGGPRSKDAVPSEGGAGAHGSGDRAAHGSIGLVGRLRGLLERWSRQAPSPTMDPVTSWTSIMAHRRDCFQAVEVGSSSRVRESRSAEGLDAHTARKSRIPTI